MIRLGDVELEKALINWREKGAELADAESSYQYYESMMKVTKGTVFLESKEKGLTIKDREAMADTHKEVIKYIDLIRTEKRRYLRLRHEISTIQESCNLFRTKSANIRGEMKLTGELGWTVGTVTLN